MKGLIASYVHLLPLRTVKCGSVSSREHVFVPDAVTSRHHSIVQATVNRKTCVHEEGVSRACVFSTTTNSSFFSSFFFFSFLLLFVVVFRLEKKTTAWSFSQSRSGYLISLVG